MIKGEENVRLPRGRKEAAVQENFSDSILRKNENRTRWKEQSRDQRVPKEFRIKTLGEKAKELSQMWR